MRLSLHRIPRESKVAAVVLGAALVQVGVLAAFGLQSTSERRREFEQDLAESSRKVVRNVVAEAAARVGDEEVRLARELSRGDALSPWDRVTAAMDGHVAPAFKYAYLVASDGRLADYQRPPIEPPPSTPPDTAARARLAEVLRLETAEPERAVEAALALAEDLAKKTPHDVVAAALALQSGSRAAYKRNERDRARALAKKLLDHYAAVRDDRGTLSVGEPMGPAASAVVCEVLFQSLKTAPQQGRAFVDEVIARRVQAQRLRPLLSDAAYRFEVDACEKLRSDATALFANFQTELADGLLRCRALDDAQQRAESVTRRALRDAAKGEDSTRFTLDARSLLTVIPFAKSPDARPGDPVAAAFVAPESGLKAEAVDPAVRAPALPAGVALVVRDAANHDMLHKVEGPLLLDKSVPFGSAAPGLFANVVLVDASMLDREATSARRLWLAILVGAAFAVVAASLLAVRAVLREVRLARMKSDFVSNLSHELRTPLTSLRMFVEMLREGRVRDEAEAKECLDVVAQETERLQSLVERVLQFASFTKGRAPIELKSSDAGEVARRAVAIFKKRAEAARATLELVVEDPLPESILDRDAILQVLLNLLDNAVKYAGDNGAKIRVGVRPGGPAGASAGRGVVIEVEDDGPGVPEKERELVFEEFYRGDDTLSRRVEGTGIGLAVARRIALAHGGRIEVTRSERLGGACFAVTLPDAETGRRLALAASRGHTS
jgi:signal transduction histidine kinase